MKIVFSFILLVLFTGVTLLYADEVQVVKDTILIHEVVVTGSPVKVSRGQIPLSVSVVNQSQIAESDESALLPVISGRVPGLFVTERGVTGFGVAAGSAGQISIRGVGGSPTTGVLMLIDGHPQFMGIFGHPLSDSYVASDVERVEVIRGPASVLYGSNAMGGVINIITKKQHQDGLNGHARFMYGSFNTQKYMVSSGYKKNKISVFGSLNHDRTDGHRPASDFEITNGYVKTNIELSKHLNATADFSLAGFKASDPGGNFPGAKPGEKIDITRGYSSFTLLNEFENMTGLARFFYNFGEHTITDGFHSTDHHFGLNLYETYQFNKNTRFTVGVDFSNNGGMAENLKAMQGRGIVFADTSVYELGIYGFIQQNISEELVVNAGLRYNEHRTYGSEWVPSLGLAYQIGESSSLKAGFSKGFRSPTMRELFLWGPNPELRPERILNYEIGWMQGLFDEKLKLELTGFMLKGDNMIQQIPNQGFRNSGEIVNSGLEFSADGRIGRFFTCNLAYSYIHMKNRVYASPRHQLFIGGNYRLGKILLNANVQQVTGIDTDPGPALAEESYTLLNGKVSYQLTKFARLFLSGENLLGQSYEINRYYPMPGTSFFAGVNLNF